MNDQEQCACGTGSFLGMMFLSEEEQVMEKLF